MARSRRRETVDPYEVAVYHCVSRCVRRAYLLGKDPYNGNDYSDRKEWIEELTREFVQFFAIDLISLAIMINHIHHLLRSRPDLVQKWSDKEVARRWLNICPGEPKKQNKKRKSKGSGPTETEIKELAQDKQRIKKIRKRLSNISWFLGKLKEKIARKANAEDEVTGCFFASRFHSTRLDSPAAVLACSVYIDLNMIRAGVATCPEDSFDTSIYHRIVAMQSRRNKTKRKRKSSRGVPLPYDPQADAYLAPTYELEEAMRTNFAKQGLRASDNPAFDINFDQYVELVDRTGREQVVGKNGSICKDLAPILERLNIQPNEWTSAVKEFGSWACRVVGTPEQMQAAAEAAGRMWYQGINRCRKFFQPPPPDE